MGTGTGDCGGQPPENSQASATWNDRDFASSTAKPAQGARSALDEALEELGLRPGRIDGYKRELAGHLEVAAAIGAGEADVGITIRVAADAYGLDFIPLREERYDLVILERETASDPIKAMLEALNSRRFAREVSQLCAYDTSQMGRAYQRG